MNAKPTSDLPILIIGGGPNGLFFALAAHHFGLPCLIIEAEKETHQHSKSIGLHPPSLHLLKELGLISSFLAHGNTVTQGQAYIDGKKVGSLSFESLKGSYPFVLTHTQFRTEARLWEAVERRSIPTRRGERICAVNLHDTYVEVHSESGCCFKGTYIIDTTGKHSFLPQKLGIKRREFFYSHTYIMGDFPDNLLDGHTAHIFLGRQGLVESFPLEQNRRRWVAKMPAYTNEQLEEQLRYVISERTPYHLPIDSPFMLSSFKTSSHILNTPVKDRCFFLGDSAHTVSPIGGQGMNLGWIHGWNLAFLIRSTSLREIQHTYTKMVKKNAFKARKRSEFNMWMGASTLPKMFRQIGVKAILHPWFNPSFNTQFTMSDFELLGSKIYKS